MFEVTVEDSFAAGHYLRNYKGKCENPHGHNYKVRVTLQGRELDHAGLLLDVEKGLLPADKTDWLHCTASGYQKIADRVEVALRARLAAG